MDLSKLKEPFPAKDIEWRIQRSGLKDGKPWAMVLAYVTNRAIMDRLDDVCGAGDWCNEFKDGPNGGLLCGIGIRVETGITPENWVTKWDGADNTDIEKVKGGLSGAMKRAGVQWGIGRYLYNLEAGFANIHPGGAHRDSIKNIDGTKTHIKWDPPPLPDWALGEIPGSGPQTPLNPTPTPSNREDKATDIPVIHPEPFPLLKAAQAQSDKDADDAGVPFDNAPFPGDAVAAKPVPNGETAEYIGPPKADKYSRPGTELPAVKGSVFEGAKIQNPGDKYKTLGHGYITSKQINMLIAVGLSAKVDAPQDKMKLLCQVEHTCEIPYGKVQEVKQWLEGGAIGWEILPPMEERNNASS